MTVDTATMNTKKPSALAALVMIPLFALTACDTDDNGNGGDNGDAEDSVETEEDTDDNGTDDGADDAAEDDDTDDAGDEDGTEDDEDGGDHAELGAVSDVVQAIYADYGDDSVILEIEDEGDKFDVEFYSSDDSTIYEVDVTVPDYEIEEEDDEGSPDSEKQDKIDAVETDFLDAVEVVASGSSGEFEEAEIEDEDGTVVWEIEFDDGEEYKVDVATGDLLDDED